MRLESYKKFLFLLASVLCAWGCSDNYSRSSGAGHEIYITVSQSSGSPTKTVIGGENLDRVFWCESDKIGFYFTPDGTADRMQSSELGAYRIYPDHAVFSATLPDGIQDIPYDCFAVCPVPESVSGFNATFTLPAQQKGTYTSTVSSDNYDFMVASPASGVMLSLMDSPLQMAFSHKTHVMRIQVPSGRNKWGADIKKIRIEFPVPVVGKLTVDMSRPDAAPVLSEGTGTVYLDLNDVLNESEEDSPDGVYVWAFLAPVTVRGEVKFTAYDTNNYQSETISLTLDKELQPGRITPVNLTVPEELPVTWIDMTVTGNNLGEDIDSFTVTAPEGARFRNGTDKMTFARNDSNLYPIGFYASYDGIDNASIFRTGDFTIEYESQNAIVSDAVRFGDFQPGGHTSFGITVPYLLYEDFSEVSEASGSNTTSTLETYGLSGWSGSNFSMSAGTSFRMHMYQGTSTSSLDNRYGRLDSSFLTGLKEGATVDLEVSFDIGGTTASGTLSNPKIMYSRYAFGSDKTQGAISYENDIENIVVGYEDAGSDGGYENLPLHKTVQLQGITCGHRLSWRASFRNDGGSLFSTITAKTVYVYVDNIKVSIKH